MAETAIYILSLHRWQVGNAYSFSLIHSATRLIPISLTSANISLLSRHAKLFSFRKIIVLIIKRIKLTTQTFSIFVWHYEIFITFVKTNLNDMSNQQIISSLKLQLAMRNNRPKITSTAYPDSRLSFNNWAAYIRREAVK